MQMRPSKEGVFVIQNCSASMIGIGAALTFGTIAEIGAGILGWKKLRVGLNHVELNSWYKW